MTELCAQSNAQAPMCVSLPKRCLFFNLPNHGMKGFHILCTDLTTPQGAGRFLKLTVPFNQPLGQVDGEPSTIHPPFLTSLHSSFSLHSFLFQQAALGFLVD